MLRHLAEVLRARDSAARGVFRVTLISAAAAAGLGLQACESPNSLCDFIRSEQDRWAEAYLAQYPHRRLVWQPLGEAEILWRHAKGETLLVLSEPQAHALLSVARLELPELPELPLAEPWAALAGPLGPLELDVDARAVRLRTACDAPRLDLTTLPEMVRAKDPHFAHHFVSLCLTRLLSGYCWPMCKAFFQQNIFHSLAMTLSQSGTKGPSCTTQLCFFGIWTLRSDLVSDSFAVGTDYSFS